MIVTLKTGFGYIEKDNVLIDGFMYSKGDHVFADGVTVIEVANKKALKAIMNKTKEYDQRRFLGSCILDANMQAILDKLDAKQEARLITCLQNGAFDIASGLITALLSSGIVTSDDIDYFKTKLTDEEGITI